MTRWNLIALAMLTLGACTQDDAGSPADGDAADLDVAAEAPPMSGRAACLDAGWSWFSDTAVNYCNVQSDVDPSCPPPVTTCFCARRCSDDSDCAGLTQTRCAAVTIYERGDAAHCSTYRVCVAADATAGLSGCVLPPNGQACE